MVALYLEYRHKGGTDLLLNFIEINIKRTVPKYVIYTYTHTRTHPPCIFYIYSTHIDGYNPTCANNIVTCQRRAHMR